jgi:hypothetical protein
MQVEWEGTKLGQLQNSSTRKIIQKCSSSLLLLVHIAKRLVGEDLRWDGDVAQVQMMGLLWDDSDREGRCQLLSRSYVSRLKYSYSVARLASVSNLTYLHLKFFRITNLRSSIPSEAILIPKPGPDFWPALRSMPYQESTITQCACTVTNPNQRAREQILDITKHPTITISIY